LKFGIVLSNSLHIEGKLLFSMCNEAYTNKSLF